MTKATTKELTGEKISIGLDAAKRSAIVRTLNVLLADEFVLYAKTRNYHWNVTGPRFHDLHKFFEDQYEKLDEIMDDVAENARQFGGLATGTMTQFLKDTRLAEKPGDVPSEDGMIANLLADHETVIRGLREDIGKTEDLEAADAADFLTAVLQDHNKMAWMLRSFLSK